MPKTPEFTRVLVVRCTPEEENAAKDAARAEGFTLSQWVRSLIRRAVGSSSTPPKARPNRPQKEK